MSNEICRNCGYRFEQHSPDDNRCPLEMMDGNGIKWNQEGIEFEPIVDYKETTKAIMDDVKHLHKDWKYPYSPSRLDYFTAKAMQGLCANVSLSDYFQESGDDVIGEHAAIIAKATIAELDKEE